MVIGARRGFASIRARFTARAVPDKQLVAS
jgi:hypothetical protein